MNQTSKTQANYERLANIFQPNRPEPKPALQKPPSENMQRTNKQILQDIIDGTKKQ